MPDTPLSWTTEKRKIKDLIPFEGNPRRITKKHAADLEDSLKKFGLADIPVVNADNKLIGGHQRTAILMLLGRGEEEIDVRIPNRKLNRREFEELNIRLNKNQAEWDMDLLAHFDLDLLIDSGFTKEDLSHKFTMDLAEDGFDAAAEYEKIHTPRAKKGEIYQLGRHRLMCGDSTDAEDVGKLMAGELADMVFTDPPYGVNYSQSKYKSIRKTRKDPFANEGKIIGDDLEGQKLYNFLFDSFTLISQFTKPGAPLYCCFATKTELEFRIAYRDAGFHFSQTIIWLKERIIMAMGQDYHRCYEPIIFGWKEGGKHYKDKNVTKEKEVWDLDRMKMEDRLDLWYISRDKSKDYIHPTQKPIKLIERALRRNSRLDDLLFEPFNGSASTLMACEQSGRRCYAMELDPKYIDVAILRFEQMTGTKAKLLG